MIVDSDKIQFAENKYFSWLKKYRFDIIWMFITLAIILLINIAYMYSRDKTLSTVEKNDFKVFSKLMYVTSLNTKKFIKVANALTIQPHSSRNKARQALFQIAMVTSKECVENAKHPRNEPFLCKIFPNSDAIESILKKTNTTMKIKKTGKNITRVEYSTKELGLYDSRYNAYLIQKRKNTHKWIIAKKRYYYGDSAWKNFYFFITKRYIQTTSFSSKWRYTKHSIYVILLASFFLWLFFKSREQQNSKRYRELIRETNNIKSKIINKENEYNTLKDKIYILEEEIRLEELKLTSGSMDRLQSKLALEDIRKKTVYQTQLHGASVKLKDEIISLEMRSEMLEELMDKNRVKLNIDKRNAEYRKMTLESKAVKQLWRHEPTWSRRKQIETTVSLIENNLPFTLTQAFIAFERYIENEVERLFEGQELEEVLDKTLIKKIDIISKKKKISRNEQNLYHEIRKARNKWVHGAIYPSKELLEKLLSVLEKTDMSPPL